MSTEADMQPDPTDASGFSTLILGIGNILWADEGFGVRAVELLNERYVYPDDVRVMDGGTQGIFLLPWVRDAERLLIFDAVDFGDPPGTVRIVRGDDVPRFMGARKMSMHQAGFQEVLSTAALAGSLPGEIALVGVQPQQLDDYGGSLRPVVRAALAPAVELGVSVTTEWNVAPQRRRRSPGKADRIGPDALDIGDYESGRPLRRNAATPGGAR